MEIFLLNKQGLVYTIGIFTILTVSLLILMITPQNSFAQPTTLTNMSKPIDGYKLYRIEKNQIGIIIKLNLQLTEQILNFQKTFDKVMDAFAVPLKSIYGIILFSIITLAYIIMINVIFKISLTLVKTNPMYKDRSKIIKSLN